MIKAFTISALVCSLLQSAFACTTALVTKGASADGSVFVTHSNDGYTGDTSVVYVPASDHAEGEKRAVYPSACAREPYPTYNTDYTPRLNVKEEVLTISLKVKRKHCHLAIFHRLSIPMPILTVTTELSMSMALCWVNALTHQEE